MRVLICKASPRSEEMKKGPDANLTETARRIGRPRNRRCCGRRARVRRDLGRRRLRQADSRIHFEVLLGAAWAIRFARILIAQAGQFVAAMNAVAISRRGSRFNRHQSHWSPLDFSFL